MTEEPLQLQVAIFQGEAAARRARDELRQARKAHIITVRAMARVWRDEDGQLQIKESSDPDGRRGALAGGIIGAIIGLLGGPGGVLVAGAAGALVGGLTAKIIDSGVPDPNLQVIGQSLLPGDSAVVVIVDDQWRDQTHRILRSAGGRLLSGTLTSVVAEQLELPPKTYAPAAEDSQESR